MGQVVEFVPATEQTLSELAKAELPAPLLKLFPKKGPLSRAVVVSAFQDAFSQIGGVSRLALWADSHPEEFFKLYARLLPPSSHPDLDDNKEYLVRHVLPPTALDKNGGSEPKEG